MLSMVTALPGQDTLLGSWSALAQLSRGATLIHSAATVAAVFPSWAPLNNAIMLAPHEDPSTAAAVSQVATIYADAGVDAWAFWLPTTVTDLDAPDGSRAVHGLKRDTTTLVMQASLSDGLRQHDGVVRTSIATATRASDEGPVPAADLEAPETVPGLSGWVILDDDVAAAGAWTFFAGNDCGIYSVRTLAEWRRRGFARALMEHVLADAQHHGARTATLQSTRIGQALYESVGFQAVGRYEEWVPLFSEVFSPE